VPTAAPAPTATARPAPTAAPAPTAIATTAPPTATAIPPTATATNTPVPTPTQSAFEAIFLAFSSPEFFDDFVETPAYTIIGRTRVDAFVTIVDIDENGQFSLGVTLEEGINVYEVVSSVSDTEQLNEVLTIIYVP
jgi:hypothetical protein